MNYFKALYMSVSDCNKIFKTKIQNKFVFLLILLNKILISVFKLMICDFTPTKITKLFYNILLCTLAFLWYGQANSYPILKKKCNSLKRVSSNLLARCRKR
ncbi:hypothetical protein EDEG_02665 [Edhazardia aedis USNM 41457]|uniref:Uncharacterized protein n=1 Tax=Edhazardia aedis (strain USNM 41457) TaxID=1003232 RepID=J8ZTD5_EDHAE|nr:hypothetical protein EDEG_02665 [Edhazardia aedis USNM 41457]|eukprot:EJW02948.1 hypothetical protein EDEG_02665 [Edhazardia aedis USNM 41457]